jgi:hypothetical protein
MIDTPDDLIRPEVRLTDGDGNAGSVIGACVRALRRAGNTPEVIQAFRREAMSGDYDHVLETAITYCEVE